MAEGEKGVAWADQSIDSLRDVSLASLSLSQQALFDTFIVKASPARRLSLDKHSPPSAAVRPNVLTGILSNGCTGALTGPSNQPNQPHEWEGGLSSTEVLATVTNSGSTSHTPWLQPRGIPDKPRMPTPLDDSSSSCSSSSTYSTRLNTVLNSYHPQPGTVGMAKGLAQTGSLRPHKKLVKQLSAPEPYLTPHLKSCQEHLNDCGNAGKRNEQQQVPVTTANTTTYSSTPLRNGDGVIMTSLAGSLSASKPVQSRIKDSSLSTSFTKLFSEAAKFRTVPIPVPCPVSPSQLQTQSNPSQNGIDQLCDPQVAPSRKPWDEFEDDFVSSRHDQSLQCGTSSTHHTLTTHTSTTSLPSQHCTSFTTDPHTSPSLPPSLSHHSFLSAHSTASKTKLHRTAGRQAVSIGNPPSSSPSSFNAHEGVTHKENSCSAFSSESKNSAFSKVFKSSCTTREGVPVTTSFSDSRKAVFVTSEPPNNTFSSPTQHTGVFSRYQSVSTAPSTAVTVPTSTSSSPSPSSYRHSQPQNLCRPYPTMSPMVTVQTHSTVVSLHPASNATPSAHHSITVGLSHTHESEESRTRPRQSAFAPPSSFSSVHKHSHTSVSSSSSSSSSLHKTQQHVDQGNQEKDQAQHKSEQDNQQMEQGNQETEHQKQKMVEAKLVSGQDHKQLKHSKKDILHSQLIHSAKPLISKQPLPSNPALNSTFTVPPTKSHHRLLTIPVAAPHGGPDRARVEDSALNTLHVNSPKALEDRVKGSSTQGE